MTDDSRPPFVSYIDLNCLQCKYRDTPIGEANEDGSYLIFRTGTDKERDWLGVLENMTFSDPELDFTLTMLPVGHFQNDAQMIAHPALLAKKGLTYGVLSRAMQMVRYDDHKDDLSNFNPTQRYSGCCEEERHLHQLIFPLSGDIDKPFPNDPEWRRKELFHADGRSYVRADPVTLKDIDPERLEHLARELTRYSSKFYKQITSSLPKF